MRLIGIQHIERIAHKVAIVVVGVVELFDLRERFFQTCTGFFDGVRIGCFRLWGRVFGHDIASYLGEACRIGRVVDRQCLHLFALSSTLERESIDIFSLAQIAEIEA